MNYVIYGISFLVSPKKFVFKKEEEPDQDLEEIIISEGEGNG